MSAGRWATRAALFLFLALPSGCSSGDPSHSVSAKNYDRTCTSVVDCFPVYEGPVGCCGAGCPNAVIRQDALAKYMNDFDRAVTATCHDLQPPCPSGQICSGEAGRVACDNGVCQLEVQASDAGPDE